MSELERWLQRLEKLHPSEIDLGLDRIRAVAERLALGKPANKVITVAGTNGKGSCVAAAGALLRAAGYSVGSYTSPHLLAFNERIRINGECVGDAEIVAAFEAIEAARGETSLTYFEYTTLAGLLIFSNAGLDFAVLEVGLGGRLDAVNLVDADIGIVTSVDIDHVDWLGDDIEVIGREKAGIFRPGKFAIIGDPHAPASVAQVAKEKGAVLYRAGKAFSMQPVADGWHWHLNDLRLALPALQLPPASVASALAALSLAAALPEPAVIHSVLAGLTLPGRCQQVEVLGRRVILDVGHNPQAARYLAAWLDSSDCKGRIFALFAAMADKDLAGLLQPLREQVHTWGVAPLPGNPRAATLEQLGTAVESVAVEGACHRFDSVREGLEQFCRSMASEDRLLVFGSFFTVAEVLQYLREQGQGG